LQFINTCVLARFLLEVSTIGLGQYLCGNSLGKFAGTILVRTYLRRCGMPGEASRVGSGASLKVGDWVEVRSFAEICATLDAQSSLDALPFMPEMARFCGRRFKVFKRAHKACDTIDTYMNRSMADAVHLELRCDGSAHGGCQAGCLIYWKTAWLKPVEGPPQEDVVAAAATQPTAADLAILQPATRQRAGDDGKPRYRCQTTELREATTPLSHWAPRQYVEDVASGNVGWRDFLRSVALEFYNKVQSRIRVGRPYPSVHGSAPKGMSHTVLDLRPGERVQVRSKAEIMATLGADQKNRGLWFDVEMLQNCGREYRVQRRVEQIIDEKTGKMIQMRNDCIVLDGAVCNGLVSRGRLFCPRSIPSYWREAWLQRIPDAGSK
jgi:hypothetical protein